MSEVSIAEARDKLTRLIQKAEAGEPVHITRRGKPVAVLVSEQDFARIEPHRKRRSPMEILEQWRVDVAAAGPEAWPHGNEFDDVRDRRPDPPHRTVEFE